MNPVSLAVADGFLEGFRTKGLVTPEESIPDCPKLTFQGMHRRVAEILEQVKELSAAQKEGHIHLPGHVKSTYDGYIRYVVLFKERGVGWLDRVVEIWSDEKLTVRVVSVCANNDPTAGIHLEQRKVRQ